MYQEISRVNDKVEKLQRNQKTGGYVNGVFPGKNDAYPCMADFSFPYWQKIWHTERGIEYFKHDGYWLSTQILSSTVLAKEVGKIFLDFEYYTYVESIFVHTDEFEDGDTIFINVNGLNVEQVAIKNEIEQVDFNNVLLLNEYLTVYLNNNKPALVQIKYRLVG